MHVVVFGLSLSSSWGNGHATLWRGLVKALTRRGHTVVFYEKDVPYYAAARDGWVAPAAVQLRLYKELAQVQIEADREMSRAAVALATSYCGDGAAAARLVLQSASGLRVFYDLDTPVTLDAFVAGARVSYLPDEGLAGFDLVLSYTGGRALAELQTKLGARRAAALYGWVDPEVHQPVSAGRSCDLSYLGTYASDRQAALQEMLLRPALDAPHRHFRIGGAQYPDDIAWPANVEFVHHAPPWQHPHFFCSSRATLNITRRAMAQYGWCPSVRLFEAAACGTPLLTDVWDGLGEFFELGTEILPVRTGQDVLQALDLTDSELQRVAQAARAKVLEHHTADARALQFEKMLAEVRQGELAATA